MLMLNIDSIRSMMDRGYSAGAGVSPMDRFRPSPLLTNQQGVASPTSMSKTFNLPPSPPTAQPSGLQNLFGSMGGYLKSKLAVVGLIPEIPHQAPASCPLPNVGEVKDRLLSFNTNLNVIAHQLVNYTLGTPNLNLFAESTAFLLPTWSVGSFVPGQGDVGDEARVHIPLMPNNGSSSTFTKSNDHGSGGCGGGPINIDQIKRQLATASARFFSSTTWPLNHVVPEVASLGLSVFNHPWSSTACEEKCVSPVKEEREQDQFDEEHSLDSVSFDDCCVFDGFQKPCAGLLHERLEYDSSDSSDDDDDCSPVFDGYEGDEEDDDVVFFASTENVLLFVAENVQQMDNVQDTCEQENHFRFAAALAGAVDSDDDEEEEECNDANVGALNESLLDESDDDSSSDSSSDSDEDDDDDENNGWDELDEPGELDDELIRDLFAPSLLTPDRFRVATPQGLLGQAESSQCNSDENPFRVQAQSGGFPELHVYASSPDLEALILPFNEFERQRLSSDFECEQRDALAMAQRVAEANQRWNLAMATTSTSESDTEGGHHGGVEYNDVVDSVFQMDCDDDDDDGLVHHQCALATTRKRAKAEGNRLPMVCFAEQIHQVFVFQDTEEDVEIRSSHRRGGDDKREECERDGEQDPDGSLDESDPSCFTITATPTSSPVHELDEDHEDDHHHQSTSSLDTRSDCDLANMISQSLPVCIPIQTRGQWPSNISNSSASDLIHFLGSPKASSSAASSSSLISHHHNSYSSPTRDRSLTKVV